MTQLHDVASSPLGIHHEGDEAVIPFWQGIPHCSYIDWSYQSEQESCTDGTVLESGSIQGMIKEEPSVSISLVQERITAKYGFKVSYRKAWYAKQKAIAIMYEQSLVTGKKVFHRIFWMFRQCCEAFKFAKLVIQIDGTHLYGKYKGKTLDAWNYFLVNIRARVTDMSNICLISDRHRSIISTVENNPNWQPPNAYHVFCIRHIASNFNQKFRNEGLKHMLKNLGYIPAIVDFERNLASFRESSPQIAEWIDDIPKEKWSRAYDIEGRRYGHMTTNLAESVNRVFKGARNISITALVKHTYSRLVAYFVERGTNVVAQLQSAHRHSKNVVELVKKNQVDATGHHVRAYNVEHTVFEVNAGWERSYSVNLPQRFCQCGKFKAFKYPCSHAVVAALSVRQSAFTYVDDVFLTTNLVEAYSFSWESIGNEEAIPEISGPKIIPDATMLRAKGRPKSTRIRNEMDEVETSQSRIRCGLCKERGHNRRGCPSRGRND
ncbi:uncharacterized protein LOC133310171 [Gastrolobium bilobum]|uniref:uncharacterized protein LOC133292936 n=1 Tax=Gastrolobium bilobum TaxID=150636 RepID=UPI002AB0EF21|nr:uncharacterized protein LOC133292936 [Gastrolobium bilobum]XP_061367054.1 uncharacterized protein LOC133310171 [Gastrolobium bilobum]